MDLPSNYEMDLGPHSRAQNMSSQMFAKRDNEDRTVMGSVITEELDVPSPRVFQDPVTDEVISVSCGNDPVDLFDVVNGEVDRPIDEDTLLDAYATKILLGDTDAHARNIAVLPDGTSYSFDFGHSVSDIGYTMRYVSDKVKANFEKLDRETDIDIEISEVEQELRDRVDDLAEDIDVSRVKGKLDERREVPHEKEYDDHLTNRINNLKKAIIGCWSIASREKVSGLSSPPYLLPDEGSFNDIKPSINLIDNYRGSELFLDREKSYNNLLKNETSLGIDRTENERNEYQVFDNDYPGKELEYKNMEI